MDQDWEWEDLLDDKPARKREPSGKTRTKSGTKKKTGAKSGTSAKSGSSVKTGTGRGKKKSASSEKKPEAKSRKPEVIRPEKKDEVNTLTEGLRFIDGEAPSISGSSEKKAKSGSRKRRRRRRRSKVFWICYLIFVLALAVAGVFIVRGVRRTMEEMRDNAPETFIRQSLQQLTDDDLLRLFETNPAYETQAESAANIRSVIESDEVFYKRMEHNAYEAFLGDHKLFEARLNATESVNKLGLINYDILESCAITPIQGNELFHYEIKAPSTCEITVNGNPVGDAISRETIDGFADAEAYVKLPSVNLYVLEALTKEPEIRVRDNGMDVAVTLSEMIDLTVSGETGHRFDSTEAAGIDFDALEFARQWTMFNRNDLKGELHGYYTIEEYLVPDSQMCILAHQYANSQDIGWTSNHVLLDPPFTDETVSNVVKYDDNTASVEVALKMHMLLDRGAERTDSIHTTLYLIKKDGEWKVINTRDVGDDE